MKKNKIIAVICFALFLMAVIALMVAYATPLTTIETRGKPALTSTQYLWTVLGEGTASALQILLIGLLLTSAAIGLFLNQRLAKVVAGSLSFGASVGYLAMLINYTTSFLAASQKASGQIYYIQIGTFAGFIMAGLFALLGIFVLGMGISGKDEKVEA
jgi:hypothetical protein